jgi:Domain of unknown function (DUF4410)
MKKLAVAAAAILAAAALSAQEPVKKIEDGVLDRIELFAASIDQPRERTVIVKPFDSSNANLGTGGKDGKTDRQEEARTMQDEGPRVLADRLVAALDKENVFKAVRVFKADDAAPDKALVVDGKFLELDPGSRAKRYFAGFGAGKSAVKVTGSIKDASGKTLATFTQRRVGAMGFGGGDSLGKLLSDSRRIAEDIASFLAKWARGDDLDG